MTALLFFPLSNLANIEDLGLTYIHDYAESLAGLPALGSKSGGNWNEKTFNLETLLSTVRKGTNSLPLFDIAVGQDDKNPTQNILFVSCFSSSLTLNHTIPHFGALKIYSCENIVR